MNIESLVKTVASLPARAVLEAASGKRVYVVGGPIRDSILRREWKDLDLAIEGPAAKVASDFASKIGGRFIELDVDFDETRVVAGDYIYDFSGFPEGGLLGDLRRRDFTINSMAVDLEGLLKGKLDLIDPFGGAADLQDKVLRVTSNESFSQDPLRVLRAFRFAAELGFDIEPGTLDQVRSSRSLLSKVHAERISYELMVTFSQRNSYPSLTLMSETSVLCAVFPQLEKTKGVAQDKLHPVDVYGHSLETYRQVENTVNHIDASPFAAYSDLVNQYLTSAPRRVALLKMAGLLHDIAKPDSLQPGDDDRLHFYGHDRTGALAIEEFATNGLRMSKKDAKMLFTLTRNHMWPHLLAAHGDITERAMKKFFRELEDEAVGALLLAWADSLASVGPERSSSALRETIDGLLRFYTERKEEVVRPPLITGKDLIEVLGLTPGPVFSRILKEVERQRDEGTARTRLEAIEIARRILSEG
jgi:poly(A) polymerase